MKDLSHSTALSLLQSHPIAMLLIDGNDKIQGFNNAFAALLGEAAATLQGASPADGLVTSLLGPGTLINWIMPDGDERWLTVEACTVDTDPGMTARFYQDVTEKLRLRNERDSLQAALKEQALRNEQLPGLLSRYGIEVSLEPLVSRSRRYDSPLSLVCISIDSSHDRDKAVTKISYLLKDQTRWADLVGCTDGHDFILILQETTQGSALQLVDKLATRITQMNNSAEHPIHACYGITECRKNDDVDSMLDRAEAALTDARQSDSGTVIATEA
ncbi:MAG TPA: diguanylate cyclase [Gammaproteobacteria bacterium]|nr:diguanylate cyclase [Gammaproteobacteria bacterium]